MLLFLFHGCRCCGGVTSCSCPDPISTTLYVRRTSDDSLVVELHYDNSVGRWYSNDDDWEFRCNIPGPSFGQWRLKRTSTSQDFGNNVFTFACSDRLATFASFTGIGAVYVEE